jgi:hypothetical protein
VITTLCSELLFTREGEGCVYVPNYKMHVSREVQQALEKE